MGEYMSDTVTTTEETIAEFHAERRRRMEVVRPSIFCPYFEGMFSNEDRMDDKRLEYWSDQRATAYHEAGHAVASYAQGLGCGRIELSTIRPAPGMIAHKGEFFSPVYHHRRVNRQTKRGEFDSSVLAAGVVFAAGPAAERKFCMIEDLPVRALGHSQRDHDTIDAVACRLALVGGRWRFAYRRLVWRRAQLLVDDETVWLAVIALSQALIHLWLEADDVVMYGPTARAIMRRAGVTNGAHKRATASQPAQDGRNAPWMDDQPRN